MLIQTACAIVRSNKTAAGALLVVESCDAPIDGTSGYVVGCLYSDARIVGSLWINLGNVLSCKFVDVQHTAAYNVANVVDFADAIVSHGISVESFGVKRRRVNWVSYDFVAIIVDKNGAILDEDFQDTLADTWRDRYGVSRILVEALLGRAINETDLHTFYVDPISMIRNTVN